MLEYDIIVRDGETGALRLEGDPADPGDCYLLQQVDGLDGRELRDTVVPIADADGEVLGPQHLGGLAVSITGLMVAPSAAALRARERALRAAVAGGGGGPVWRMRLTGRSSDPEDMLAWVRTAQRFVSADEGASAGPRLVKAFAFAVRAREAVLEGAQLRAQSVFPPEVEGGLVFPVAFALSFGGAADAGVPVTNAGDALAWPTLRVVGPCAGPILENLTTGRALYFSPTLALAAGEELVIDPRPGRRTVLLGGSPGQSRYYALERAGSAWWGLAPGVNALRFRAATQGEGCHLALTWRNAYT